MYYKLISSILFSGATALLENMHSISVLIEVNYCVIASKRFVISFGKVKEYIEMMLIIYACYISIFKYSPKVD
jgi:hypothetical protein